MITLLVIVQGVAAVLLAAVGLFPFFRKNQNLTLLGKIIFIFGAALLIGAMSTAQIMSHRATNQNQSKIRDLIDKRFEAISALVMNSASDQPRSAPPPAKEDIKITSPENGALIKYRQTIRGEVSDQTSQVWLVVHPLGTSSYWVQPKISIKRSGEWTVTGYFGRAGETDKGRAFELLAIVDPKEDLNDGQIFNTWPEARFVSNSIIVTRQ